MKIGEIIEFGSYKWKILDEREDAYLLITESIIEQRNYHNRNTDVTWETCELRHYLNHAFYNTFTDKDKGKIIETNNLNPDNPWYKSHGGNNTIDKIFILSLDEVVRKYYGDSSYLLDYPVNNQRYWFQRKDENNIKRRSRYIDSSWWWWIRTPGKHNRVAIYIHGDGNIGIQGNGISKRNTNVIHPLKNDNRGGVRPVLWLKKEQKES